MDVSNSNVNEYMSTIKLNNSFCTLNGFTSIDIEKVKKSLTYTNEDVILEKQMLYSQIKRAGAKRNIPLLMALRGKFKALGPDQVCWLNKDNEFPTGLIHLVKESLQGSQYTISDERIKPAPYNIFRWHNKPHALRYYQQEAVDVFIKHCRGVLQLACGAGKTRIAVEIIKQLGVNTLFVVPSSALLTQAYDIFVSSFGEKNVQKITTLDMKKDKKLKPIRVATIQTLASLNKQGLIKTPLNNVDLFIMDEAHHCLSGGEKIITDKGLISIKQIVDKKIQCKVLSKSPSGALEYKEVINYFKYDAPKTELIQIEFEHNNHTKTILCTENHKIFTSNRGYTEAKDLTLEDDFIIQTEAGCPICNKLFDNTSKMSKIKSIKRIKNLYCNGVATRRLYPTVYDIEVKDNHNYFANGLLVSNSASDSYLDLLNALQPIYFRLNMTATYTRNDSKLMDLQGMSGEVIYDYNAIQATKEGYLTPVEFRIIPLSGKPDRNYQNEYKINYKCKELLESIKDLVKNKIPKDEPILILIDKKEHSGDVIYKYLIESGITCSYVTGDNTKDEIREAIEDFNDNKTRILIGSTVFGEGCDLRTTTHLIMARGGKSEIMVTQAIGRAVRLSPGKKVAIVYDFNFKYTKYMTKHLTQRVEIYQKQFAGKVVYE